MALNEFLHKIETHPLSPEAWQTIFNNTKANADQVLKQYHDRLSINFIKPDLCENKDREKVNAHAKKISHLNYEISVYPKMIEALRRYSWLVASYKDIFKSLPETNEIRTKMADNLMYMWLDFIFWHEFFHITLGHLELLEPHTTLFEFTLNAKELSEDELWFFRTLEGEADAYASRMTFTRFNGYKHSLNKLVCPDYSERDMCCDFFLGLNFFFGLFETLRNKECIQRTHPLPAERNFIVQSFLPEVDNAILKKISLNKDELAQLVSHAFIKHESFMGEKEEDIVMRLKKSMEFSIIADKYRKEINRRRKMLI